MHAEFRVPAALAMLLAAANAGAAVSPAFTPPAPARPPGYVVQLAPPPRGPAPGPARETIASRLAEAGFTIARALEGAPGAARVLLLHAGPGLSAAEALARLAADPAFAWAEPDVPREFCGFPADTALPDDPLLRDTRQWGLWNAGPGGAYRGLAGADVNARLGWAISCGSNDVRLAIADTGVDPGHPDLQRALPDGSSRIVHGRNVTTGPAGAWADSNGHGTAVAGVMAALTHDGPHFDSLGVAGLCGGDGGANAGCRLVPIRITADGGGASSAFEIARAILYATSLGARALNLSFAGGSASRIERAALAVALRHGCVVVASSGNRGHLGPGVLYPAAFAAEGLCIAVGASDARDRRALFSSYGPALDLVAPGLDVWTTALTYPNAYGARYPGYLAASGTSFAAPFVTGAIGLMSAVRPDLADVDFQQVLRATAHDLGPLSRDDETGWGRLDVAAALRFVAGSPGRPRALLHDEAAAEVRSTGRFAPLATARDSFGAFDHGREWNGRVAELHEAVVTIALPDSFADGARAWPRVGGTTTLRGDYALDHFAPWAEVVPTEGRVVRLRGYLYRVPMAASEAAAIAPAAGVVVPRPRRADPGGIEFEPDSADYWLPLPPDQARIGFTVLGDRVEPPPRTFPAPAPETAALRAWPNPARGAVRVAGPPGARVRVLDVAGRRVREARLDPARGEWSWDARDAAGRRVRPGLYRILAAGRRGPPCRVVVLDP